MYEAKDFSHLLGLKGFSDTLLQNHFKLYNGYVKNTNNAGELLKKAEAYEFGEIKRRFGWEFNGMRLHELYFGNLNKESSEVSGKLKEAIEKQFGSVESWWNDFEKTGKMRGIGWVILYADPVSGNLFNVWINEHDMGHLAGGKPLLVLDVFEHAFVTDYGLDKASYLTAFKEAIDWEEVGKRFNE